MVKFVPSTPVSRNFLSNPHQAFHDKKCQFLQNFSCQPTSDEDAALLNLKKEEKLLQNLKNVISYIFSLIKPYEKNQMILPDELNTINTALNKKFGQITLKELPESLQKTLSRIKELLQKKNPLINDHLHTMAEQINDIYENGKRPEKKLLDQKDSLEQKLYNCKNLVRIIESSLSTLKSNIDKIFQNEFITINKSDCNDQTSNEKTYSLLKTFRLF